MRCPKCHYISFGSVDRCRNCGYEFALTPEVEPLDLPIQSSDEPVGPMSDLQLRGPAPSSTVNDAVGRESPVNVQRATAASRLDLPLFTDRAPADDAPLISAPSAPRPPLSVRRAQPPVQKPRPEPTFSELSNGDADAATGRTEHREPSADPVSAAKQRQQLLSRRAASPQLPSVERQQPAAEVEATVAPVFARLVAGAIDVMILLGIDAAILFATLRVLELPLADARNLPRVPLAVFLLLLNGGYLAIFTAAGGQTIGKMLCGIRVVAARPDDDQGFDGFTLRVTMGAAVLRAAAYLVSLLPAGLGFAAILFDAEGRALHDRLAETRVIKA
jgi:uncharacterized RDD family membrane protein YckC